MYFSGGYAVRPVA